MGRELFMPEGLFDLATAPLVIASPRAIEGACEDVDSLVRQREAQAVDSLDALEGRVRFHDAAARLRRLVDKVSLAGFPIPIRIEVDELPAGLGLVLIRILMAIRDRQERLGPEGMAALQQAKPSEKPWSGPVINVNTKIDPRMFDGLEDRQVVLWLARRCVEAVIHEMREWFRFDGLLAFDPHVNGRNDHPSAPWVWTAE